MTGIKHDVAVSPGRAAIDGVEYVVDVMPNGVLIGEYGVSWEGHCSCPDHVHRGSCCKHMQAAAQYVLEVMHV